MLEKLNWFCLTSLTTTVIKLTVGHRLKPTKSRELPTKKVYENPLSARHFIIFYHSYEDWPVTFYFFKRLQAFLFLLIPILYFLSLFIKEWIQWLVFFLFLLILFFIFCISFYRRILLILLFKFYCLLSSRRLMSYMSQKCNRNKYHLLLWIFSNWCVN